MNKKMIRVLAIAGASAGIFALAPSLASAFNGNLVRCTPTAGISSNVFLKPGLTCTDTLQKIQVSTTIKLGNPLDGCVANVAAPWNAWATGKVGSKISAADAALIAKADVVIKAATFGSCNFSGDPVSSSAAGAGKFAFYDIGGNPVSGGKGSFFARVAGDLPTISVLALGLVTKGFGAGAAIQIKSGIDLANPVNALILGCNTGAICPPNVFPPTPPITTLALTTVLGSNLSIDIPDNANCTGPDAPIHCCTGVGTGTCF